MSLRSSGQSGSGQTPRYFSRDPPGGVLDFAVVGIGASAGGLEAVTRLAEALPAGIGMGFILVQHLDPNHASMMVELLTGHTGLTVRQAADGMPIERDQFYVIPPGMYLSVLHGALHLSPPEARRGTRLPFDFLLHSLSEECGRRAICVVLSGTGADGAQGVRSIKAKHGMVIAQEPSEAAFDGMPRSAIMTGGVDLVLPVAKIPYALIRRAHDIDLGLAFEAGAPPDDWPALMAGVIELLRLKTPHDFSFYKTGTLRRRIERRMGMAGLGVSDIARYLDVLRTDSKELELLGNDLLINVTRFFRDTVVFETLANSVVGDLVRLRGAEDSIRIWIAGCSTGEETYSVAILFQEEMARAGARARLRILSSDVDPEAVAIAREGLYSRAIEGEVSEDRLEQFFIRNADTYRVKPELRSAVAFTVHDLLNDPPFSRIDLVCCRNLLIYLQPEAQAKVIGALHFALREGGVLLLGQSETLGTYGDRFAVIDKSARLYRRTGRGRPGALNLPLMEGTRVALRFAPGQRQPRTPGLAELCRNLVLDSYAPAALLINRRHECLYSLGPTNRYLRLPPGHSTYDLLAMVRPGLRVRLRAGIERACQENTRLLLAGVPPSRDPKSGEDSAGYSIAVQPVRHEGEELVLVCFIAAGGSQYNPAAKPSDVEFGPTIDSSGELEATKAELADALRNLETSGDEQNAVLQEALSVNEEFQTTNEELLTSKEELQSLNEELTALNGQLHETLERQRILANDLQNILNSTDTATLFLDTDLNIRFFTPATRAIFHVIATDVGRPLADLNAYATDVNLLRDARETLQNLATITQEIEGPDATWYLRRVLPYRTHEAAVAGVVITYSDITERKHASRDLETARREADQANLAKSRFLAAASHDLRQPLQTLSLLQGLLVKKVEGDEARKLVALLDPTLTAMSGMLNTLLDINQIDAGTVRAERILFPIATILDRLREEFSYYAQAQGLRLRVVPCSLFVFSDPRLLEQMIRNLLANAFKYTRKGAVLLGCRRRGGGLRVEIWDTGIGIPEAELEAIFAEYHQLDNPARERSRGLGLGLPIVRRLSELLGHTVDVRSRPGKGSVFAIALAPPPPGLPEAAPRRGPSSEVSIIKASQRGGVILVIEDDAEVRQLLDLVLTGEGYRVVTAADGVAALGVLQQGTVRPDLILADYNLPNGMNGLQVAAKLRQKLSSQVPVIVLTGDIATDTLRAIAAQECVQVSKPVKPRELRELISRLLVRPHDDLIVPVHPAHHSPNGPVIYVVDDDIQIRDSVRRVLEASGNTVVDFASCEAFLEAYRPGADECLLIDAYLPGMDGLQLLQLLAQSGHHLPAIMITGNSDVKMAVAAMKVGAIDFIEKPFAGAELLASVARAIELSRDAGKLATWRQDAIEHLAGLTSRQREIMNLVLAGQPSKIIAADLGISQRTVENHRAAIMRKTGAISLPALARLALAATPAVPDDGLK